MNTSLRTGSHAVVACLAAAAVVVGFLTAPAPAVASERIIAIDVLVEPDATIIAAAQAVNARLREVYPEGYSLDETHSPHITLVQRYVREKDLERVTAAVAGVVDELDPRTLQMRAVGYMYVVWAGLALTGNCGRAFPGLAAAARAYH